MGKWMTRAQAVLRQEDSVRNGMKSSPSSRADIPVQSERGIQPPEPPIQKGWQVVWRNSEGKLCDGLVHSTKWEFSRWVITLESGEILSSHKALSVGRIEKGKKVEGWLVKPHGLSGPPSCDWQSAWRKVAALTDGIQDDDPRVTSVLEGLKHCDEAYNRGDYLTFHEHVRGLEALLKEPQ